MHPTVVRFLGLRQRNASRLTLDHLVLGSDSKIRTISWIAPKASWPGIVGVAVSEVWLPGASLGAGDLGGCRAVIADTSSDIFVSPKSECPFAREGPLTCIKAFWPLSWQ